MLFLKSIGPNTPSIEIWNTLGNSATLITLYIVYEFLLIHAYVHVYIKGFCLQNSTVSKVFKKWRFFMHYFPLATHILEAVDKIPALVVNSWIRTGDMVTLALVQLHRFLSLLTHQLRANQIHQVKNKRLVYLSTGNCIFSVVFTGAMTMLQSSLSKRA